MEFWHIVALAIIQGLTEFLPISSSAHLILPSQLLGWPDQGLAFDVAVHVGTLLAVIGYFRKDVVVLTRAWVSDSVQRKIGPDSFLAWAIIFATIPAGLAGLIFNHAIEENLRSGLIIAATTIGFGVLLWYADARGSRVKPLTQLRMSHALMIGLAQAIALIPGTSRSGITMTAALLLGYTREASARFSFLLSIPLIVAAGLLKGKDLLEAGHPVDWVSIGLGTALSFISALICIHFFLKFIEKLGLFPYVVYRLALGAVLLWVLL